MFHRHLHSWFAFLQHNSVYPLITFVLRITFFQEFLVTLPLKTSPSFGWMLSPDFWGISSFSFPLRGEGQPTLIMPENLTTGPTSESWLRYNIGIPTFFHFSREEMWWWKDQTIVLYLILPEKQSIKTEIWKWVLQYVDKIYSHRAKCKSCILNIKTMEQQCIIS